MKLHLLSDVHNEFDHFLPHPAAAEADVVILAGDIHEGLKGVEWAKKTFSKAVLYVPGNHEYYNGHLGKTLVKMIDWGDERVQVLDCDEVVTHGVRFLGATAWTDYSVTGDARLAMNEAREVMTDFHKIRAAHDYRKLAPLDLLERNRYTRQWLESRLSEAFAGPTVVITHHAPSLLSLYPDGRYPDPPKMVDAAYVNPWDDLLGSGKVNLWLHGHTHMAVDYTLSGTRVVSNPRGYPGEETKFDPGLLIEV